MSAGAQAQFGDAEVNFGFRYEEEAAVKQISPNTNTTNVATSILLATVVAYFIYTSVLADTGIVGALESMMSRVGGMLRKRKWSAISRDGFGNSEMLSGITKKAKTVGTETLQRGYGSFKSMVNGAVSDRPAGLGNTDNSCYQNSVVQGLASLRALPGHLERVAERLGDEDEGAMNVSILDTVRALNDAENGGRILWLPRTLRTMSTWQQQDAQEYFSKILDQAEKETAKVAQKANGTKYDLSMSDAIDEIKVGRVEDEHAETEGSQGTTLRSPLEGLLAQRVGCTSCGYTDGLSLIPFNCLTVPLGNKWSYDIRECLDEYTKVEEIDGVQCPRCTLLDYREKLLKAQSKDTTSDDLKQRWADRLKIVDETIESGDYSDQAITKRCQIPKNKWAESKKTKQAVIARAPQSFVMHVNRSQFNEQFGFQTKNTADVDFPLSFDLGDWMLGSMDVEAPKDSREHDSEHWSMDPQKSMLPEHREIFGEEGNAASSAGYELRAAIMHYGTHENGHYVCYRKHLTTVWDDELGQDVIEDGWWRMSDDTVWRVDEEHLHSQGGAFMLFYERVDASGAPVPAAEGESIAAFDPIPEEILAAAAGIPLPATPESQGTEGTILNEDFKLDEQPAPGKPITPIKPGSVTNPFPTPPASVAPSPAESTDVESPNIREDIALPKQQPILMRTANLIGSERGKSPETESPRMVQAL